ncbi:MAG: bifunctional folylpolyglutamate synthase/dihydrofolate synthase [Pseudomonadota bacterium]|nr:bifunctional folylpolyglutamate synthase/dihydrofolate synthase [Pseudomonadota bacterium]
MSSPGSGDDSARAAAALERLAALHPKLIDLGLDRTRDLLARLGNPHHRLPPVIHVAGTNGKGSVIATARAMAEAAGLRVHVYTSPHLCRFKERIRLAGSLIADGPLADLLEEVETANGDAPVTFFEVTTAAAFLAFSRVDADLLLLETGLGGALDSTNVLDAPAATVITPVARDHEHFLGSDIAGIAGQKAGIMRRGVSCIAAAQEDDALAALKDHAAAIGAPLGIMGTDIGWTPFDDGGVAIELEGKTVTLPAPALRGAHQQANAALAAAALATAMPHIPQSALADGVTQTVWPGRLHRLAEGSLTSLLDQPVWIDGAHNAHGASALAAALPAIDAGKWHFICGALNTRPASEFLSRIAPLAASIHCVAIPDQPASLQAETLAAEAGEVHPGARAAPSVAGALQAIAGGSGDADRPVMICGSLYLAGYVLAANGTLPD